MQSARVLAHFPRQWAMAQWQYTQWARTEERSFVVRHARGDDRRASYPGKMTRFRDFSILSTVLLHLLLGSQGGHARSDLRIKLDNNRVIICVDARVQKDAALLHHTAEGVVINRVT